MKRVSTGLGGIRVTFALLALCGLLFGTWVLSPARASADGGTPQTLAGEWILGLAPGEALRVIGVSNPWARSTRAVTMKFRVVGAYGTILYESDELRVAPGAMAVADVPWDHLSDAGEPGTGRFQARVVFRVVLPRGAKAGDFTPLAEIFDLAAGGTRVRTGPIADVLYSAAGNSGDDHW